MAITTLEAQRRNSVVLLETCNPPPPPHPQICRGVRPAQNDRKNKTRRIQIQPRWESAQTIRRRRIQAAERAFLDARRGLFAPGLFTHTSLFGTRTLPPPGAKALNLDASRNDFRTFMIGDRVRVRRFNFPAKHWSEWQWGEVMVYLPMRSFAGNFGHAYVVRVISKLSGQETTGKYVQFMGEICSADGPDSEEAPYVSSEECARSRLKANIVYTRVNSPGMICEIPNKDVWIPAEVLTWEDGQDIFVRPVVGPVQGQTVRVQDAIPYTLETVVACRRQGQSVAGPDGKLFLHDLSLKPLGKTLPPNLPRPVFNFPSPDALVADCVPIERPFFSVRL